MSKEKSRPALIVVGDAITQKMFNQRMSVVGLCKKSNVSNRVVYKIFKGENCNINSVNDVAEALDMEICVIDKK